MDDVWVHRENDGEVDRFDLSILDHALSQHITASKATDIIANIHDATTKVKFQVSFHVLDKILRIDPDRWLLDIEQEGFDQVERRLIRNAMEGFAPANPVKVYVLSDSDLIPNRMRLWYVNQVKATKNYDPTLAKYDIFGQPKPKVDFRDTAQWDWRDMFGTKKVTI